MNDMTRDYVTLKGEASQATGAADSSGKQTCVKVAARSKKVGQYLLGPTLSEGPFGKMKIATHLISKQQVAIKVVTKTTLVCQETARRHVRREALVLQKVGHPNILKLYEAMETSSSYYLVFEMSTARHLLGHVAERGQLSEDESRHCMRQMASAVDHLHKCGIVHRDLKLDNFLLDVEGNVKLSEFSLSNLCCHFDLTTQCGSPVYAAPEILEGKKYGHPVDVWSLGVCLFAMVAGRLPFLTTDEGSILQLYSLVLQGCSPPDSLSPPCKHLLDCMLKWAATQRITVQEVLGHDWLIGPDAQPIKRYPAMPKKLPETGVDYSIVKYMCTMYRFSERDVIASVTERRLNNSAGTYNILKDSIETGKLSLSLPTGWSNMERVSLCKRTVSKQPKTEPANCIKNNNQTSEIVSLADKSYKESIFALKQSRQRLRALITQALGDTPMSDYFFVRESSCDSSSKVDIENLLPISASRNKTSSFTLPPISSTNSVLSGVLKTTSSNVGQGQRHYLGRDHPQASALDVKGVTANLLDPNAIKHKLTHIPAVLQAFIYSPPRNTCMESLSVKNIDRVSAEKELPQATGIRNPTPSRELQHNYHIHNHEQNNLYRQTSRPSLASFWDPFGRDAWGTLKLQRGKGKEKTQNGGNARKVAFWRPTSFESLHLSESPTLRQKTMDEDGNTSPLNHRLSHCNHSNKGTTNTQATAFEGVSPSVHRADTDSPVSQSQDKEYYMTPVTRVTITTISRH